MFDCANHFRWGKLAIWFFCTCQCQLCIHTNAVALILFHRFPAGEEWRVGGNDSSWEEQYPVPSVSPRRSLRLCHLLSEAQPKPDRDLLSHLVRQPRLVTQHLEVCHLTGPNAVSPRSPSSPSPSFLLHFYRQSPQPKDTHSESGCPMSSDVSPRDRPHQSWIFLAPPACLKRHLYFCPCIMIFTVRQLPS